MIVTEQLKIDVWSKAKIVAGYDPRKYRKDQCDAWIAWDQYGTRTSCGLGWEIDHITPQSKGGSDALYNLRPLQWENNVHKSNGRVSVYVTSKANHNEYAQ